MYTSIHCLLVWSDPWQVAMMLLNNILESAPEPVSVATSNHMHITRQTCDRCLCKLSCKQTYAHTFACVHSCTFVVSQVFNMPTTHGGQLGLQHAYHTWRSAGPSTCIPHMAVSWAFNMHTTHGGQLGLQHAYHTWRSAGPSTCIPHMAVSWVFNIFS